MQGAFYETFCGCPNHRLLFMLVGVPRVVQRGASTNPLRGPYMIKSTSRKTMISNTKNMEVCDRHAQHRLGTYICTLYTNLPLEGGLDFLALLALFPSVISSFFSQNKGGPSPRSATACLQSSAVFMFGSKLDLTSRKSAFIR